MKYIQKFLEDVIGPGFSACPDIEKWQAETIVKKHPNVPSQITNQILGWCNNGQGCPDVDIGSIIEICKEYCFDQKFIDEDLLQTIEPYGIIICKYLIECSLFNRFVTLDSIVFECKCLYSPLYWDRHFDEEKELEDIKASLQILSDENIISQSGDTFYIL